jgi:6-hydroxynicotinate 3-monooxygenase
MKRTTRIVAIGAGLGGMTVAGLLQRSGFRVRIFEQAPAFSRIGAGIHLTSNVMIVMRRLGIEQALSDRGLHPDAFVSRQWDTGEILFELPFDPASEAHYGAPYINVHRGDLHAILESSLAPGTIAFNRKLRDVDEKGSAIRLHFTDGSETEADIVIGADGVHSRMRDIVLGPQKARYTGRIAHRAIFPTSLLGGRPLRDCTKWWGPDSHILVYYMTQAREEVYVTSALSQHTWDTDASFVDCDRDEFIADFAGYHPELREIVELTPEVTKWPVFEREPVDRWNRDRLVLLGDACHAMKPYMAAGAAMAIEDAAVLARCLSDLGTEDPAESFAWYEANRMARVSKVQRISAANTWLRGPTDPDWLYCYDACAVPLVAPAEARAAE